MQAVNAQPTDFIEQKPDQNPKREFQRYHELPDELQDKILRGLSVNQQIPFKVTSKQSEKQVCNTYDECWQEAFQTLKKAFEQTSLDQYSTRKSPIDKELSTNKLLYLRVTTSKKFTLWDLAPQELRLVAKVLRSRRYKWLFESVIRFRPDQLVPIYRNIAEREKIKYFFSVLDKQKVAADLSLENVCILARNFEDWIKYTKHSDIDIQQVLETFAGCFKGDDFRTEFLTRNARSFLLHLRQHVPDKPKVSLARIDAPLFENFGQANEWFKQMEIMFKQKQFEQIHSVFCLLSRRLGHGFGIFYLSVFNLDFGLEEALITSLADAEMVKKLIVASSLQRSSITAKQAKYFLRYLLLAEKYEMYKAFSKEFIRRKLVTPKFMIDDKQ